MCILRHAKGTNPSKASNNFYDFTESLCLVQMLEGWPSHVWTVPFLIKPGEQQSPGRVECVRERGVFVLGVCLDLMCTSSSADFYHQSCFSMFKYILYVGVFPCCLHCLWLLFASVHPLDVFLVVWFQLFSLEFESVGDQAGLWGPGLGA